MKKAEIKRKFDEIVAFSEVEKFIDTPVKRYSSGMYVRLAFAVAAHLQPEILLVDEVLAVGDLEFQRKCIGQMEEVAREGKTVVVVSHSMSTVKSLCDNAFLLERGTLKAAGPVDEVVAKYLNANQADAAEKIITQDEHLAENNQLRVWRVRLLNAAVNRFAVYWRQPIRVAVEIEIPKLLEEVSFGAGLKMMDGTWACTFHHDDYGLRQSWRLEPGVYVFEFTVENYLMPGLYKLCLGAHHQHYTRNLTYLEPVNLEVLDCAEDGTTPLIHNPGVVCVSSTWSDPVPVGQARSVDLSECARR